MYQRTRKNNSQQETQQPHASGHQNSQSGFHQSANQASTSHDSNSTDDPTVTIPQNKGAQRYTMNQVFDVWNDTKSQILNPSVELPIVASESYKVAQPTPIYHLELQSSDLSGSYKARKAHSKAADVNGGAGHGNGDIAREREDNRAGSGDTNGYAGGAEGSNGSERTFSNGKYLENDNQSASAPATASANNLSSSSEHLSGIDESLRNMHVQDYSIGSLDKGLSGPPPGMVHLQDNSGLVSSSLVTPDKIEWYYIDPLGTEQGPFNGEMMQDWLTGGYLDLELRIRRKEETGFKSLKEFCESVNTFILPFKVPLPAKETNNFTAAPNATASGQTSQFYNGLGARRINSSNLFGNDFSDPFSPSTPSATLPLESGNFQKFPFQQQQSQQTQQFNPNTSYPLQYSLLQQQHQQQVQHQQLQHQPHLQHTNSFNQNFQQQFQPQQFQSGQSIGSISQSAGQAPQQFHPHLQSQPILSRNNSGWGLDSINTSSHIGVNSTHTGSGPGTPVNVHQASQVSQPTPMSPWVTGGMQSSSRVSSPFVPSSAIHNNINHVSEDRILDDLHTSVVTDILKDEEPYKNQVQKAPKFSAARSAANAAVEEAAEEAEQEQKAPEKKTSSVAVAAAAAAIAATEQETASTTTASKEPTVEVLKPSIPAQQELAPWAIPKSVSKPVIGLKEIQALEAGNTERQRQIQAQLKLEQQLHAKLTEQADAAAAATTSTASQASLPKTWGSVSKPVVQKSLAEIQKEEAELAAAKAKALKAAALANASASASAPGVGVQAGAYKGPSFASAVANSTPKDDGYWTTVAAKKPVVKKATPVSAAAALGGASVKLNPQALRSVSAAKPAISNVNEVAIREEFLIWARANMTNLYPSVSRDDLLEMFITLPVNSTDSAQLISETIYSSSATMDGRRFSQEFLKRRTAVDKQLGRTEDSQWSAAIVSSADKVATVDEDGWSTGKSKKKGNKKF